MEILRQWLVGITCAAMVIALADSLTPAGTVKRIGRLAGGLVLLLAVVKPILGVDFGALATAAVQWEGLAVDRENLEKTNTDLLKSIIAEKTGAYILDKAGALGFDCQSVAVSCTLGEGGVPYPSAVTITGNLTEDQRQTLSRCVEADLAIPEECQTYESGDEGS